MPCGSEAAAILNTLAHGIFLVHVIRVEIAATKLSHKRLSSPGLDNFTLATSAYTHPILPWSCSHRCVRCKCCSVRTRTTHSRCTLSLRIHAYATNRPQFGTNEYPWQLTCRITESLAQWASAADYSARLKRYTSAASSSPPHPPLARTPSPVDSPPPPGSGTPLC